MTILCIGANGFIGKRLVEHMHLIGERPICADLRLRGVDSDIFIDVQDYKSFPDDLSVNTVINLAAEHKDNVRPISRYYSVNVEGARNVCRFATRVGAKRIVFTSSVAVYGPTTGPTDESGSLNFNSHYGESKYEAEQIYKAWQAECSEDRSLVIIRPVVVFGEGNRGNVFNLLRMLNKKIFVMIGRGDNIKSMAYVDNIAAFIHHSASLPAGIHIFNYADEPSLNMKELVSQSRKIMFESQGMCFAIPVRVAIGIGTFFDVLAKITGVEFPISRVRVEKFISGSHFISNADHGGFNPPVAVGDALLRTIEHEFKQRRTPEIDF